MYRRFYKRLLDVIGVSTFVLESDTIGRNNISWAEKFKVFRRADISQQGVATKEAFNGKINVISTIIGFVKVLSLSHRWRLYEPLKGIIA
jgi:hypothetical protein